MLSVYSGGIVSGQFRIKLFFSDGYKLRRFFSIYYEGTLFPIQIRKKECDMSRRRSKPMIAPWLSAKPDDREKRFIQVGNSLLFSEQFHALGTGSRYLYFCMAMESGGRRTFTFPQRAAKKYGIAPSSLRKHITELEKAHFIEVYSGKATREPNGYYFCLAWKLPPSPSACAPPLAICSKSGPNGHKEKH